ncbi:hypothetical protein COY95_04035 [Candidatus Woesearchaeota archaeon CG_4_10_14_0_8_um_filter_47_5]|nr:MAG: hypothetical protein COY95_04035 [Candidatus Woesearchaeota archaeon CG_4_10_14_0_8_um_filter_47_5]
MNAPDKDNKGYQMKRTRGRPPESLVRQRIIDILFAHGPLHGYALSAIYDDIFPPASRRLIYYHLKKGVELGEIELKEIATQSGDYSWGKAAERVYYTMGKSAHPRILKRVKNYKKQKKP